MISEERTELSDEREPSATQEEEEDGIEPLAHTPYSLPNDELTNRKNINVNRQLWNQGYFPLSRSSPRVPPISRGIPGLSESEHHTLCLRSTSDMHTPTKSEQNLPSCIQAFFQSYCHNISFLCLLGSILLDTPFHTSHRGIALGLSARAGGKYNTDSTSRAIVYNAKRICTWFGAKLDCHWARHVPVRDVNSVLRHHITSVVDVVIT
jgi:hypothetical protein